jgi:hypothetical protein
MFDVRDVICMRCSMVSYGIACARRREELQVKRTTHQMSRIKLAAWRTRNSSSIESHLTILDNMMQQDVTKKLVLIFLMM